MVVVVAVVVAVVQTKCGLNAIPLGKTKKVCMSVVVYVHALHVCVILERYFLTGVFDL